MRIHSIYVFCYLWRPEELWVLNPKRIFRSFDFHRRRKESERGDVSRGEGDHVHTLGSDLHYNTFDTGVCVCVCVCVCLVLLLLAKSCFFSARGRFGERVSLFWLYLILVLCFVMDSALYLIRRIAHKRIHYYYILFPMGE